MNKKISSVKYITDYNRKTNIEITEAIPAPKYAVKLNKRAYMKLINTYLTYFIIIIISPFDEI